MRVFINGWFWHQPHTGSGQYLRHLVEWLPQAAPALDLTLVIPQIGAPPPVQSAGWAVQMVPCGATNWGKVWFEQVTFPRVCEAGGAAVAHVPYWGGPLQPRGPTVVSILDLIPLLLRAYRGGPLVRLYTSLQAAAALNAAQVITISHASQRDICQHLGLPAERVHVTWLAAGANFTPPESGHAVGALPPEYVLYLGGYDVRKNIETLVGVCRWLGDEWPLVLAGTLPPRHDHFFRDPRVLARELGVETAIHCIGAVSEKDKPALYRQARAFLYPSRYEGFGLPALEALACGVPVVGSNASSIPEIVGPAGILVDPDDVEGMAGGLLAVLTDDALRAELAERAVQQAAHFSWATCAAQTAAVYAACLLGAAAQHQDAN
jgi:glycosyltransferase involved in cell wall biosynthesis